MSATTLNIGVLGAGQIAQAAHFPAVRKAKTAQLYAICDAADDLRERMAAVHQPTATFADYDAMLADDQVDAVIVAVADQFHVPLAIRAIEAGKHVLVEKPMATTVEDAEALADATRTHDRVVLVGHEKRYDPGVAFAHDFIRDEIGELIGLKHWYCDSTYRYSITNTLQPIIESSAEARRPPGNPKADRQRYLVLGHGSHMLDTARYLGGQLEAIRARLSTKADTYCWFLEVAYANGCLGQLDLTIAVRMDWWEGFQVYGSQGSVIGKLFNPWHLRGAEVQAFSVKDDQYRQPIGEDANVFRLQIEDLVNAATTGATPRGATAEDGLASVRAMVALAEVGDHRRLGQARRRDRRAGVMQLGIFAKTFDRPNVASCLQAVADAGIPAAQFNLSVAGLPTIPDEPVPDDVVHAIRAGADQAGVALAAISGTFNAAHPDPAHRQTYLDRFPHLCAAASDLQIDIITLSSGSRDPDDMWRWHPDNTTAQAWADSRTTLQALAALAEDFGLTLAVEPEHSNVVATAEQAIMMLDQVASPALKIVYDAANLLDPDDYDPTIAADAITRDIATLGPHIALAHAKELIAHRAPAAPGAGMLPWPLIVQTLHKAGFDGTLVTHGLPETSVPLAVATLSAALATTGTP